MRQSKRQREMQMSDAFVEDVSYDIVFMRDQGMCGICGLPVIYAKSGDNNWSGSGTVDHIVPLSVGGEHSLRNCQLAHRICNSLKSNREGFGGIDWESPERITTGDKNILMGWMYWE